MLDIELERVVLVRLVHQLGRDVRLVLAGELLGVLGELVGRVDAVEQLVARAGGTRGVNRRAVEAVRAAAKVKLGRRREGGLVGQDVDGTAGLDRAVDGRRGALDDLDAVDVDGVHKPEAAEAVDQGRRGCEAAKLELPGHLRGRESGDHGQLLIEAVGREVLHEVVGHDIHGKRQVLQFARDPGAGDGFGSHVTVGLVA